MYTVKDKQFVSMENAVLYALQQGDSPEIWKTENGKRVARVRYTTVCYWLDESDDS